MNQITVRRREGMAEIVLNRPEKMNALSSEMAMELKRQLEELREREDVSFVVLTGAGSKAFCTGGDLTEFHGDLTALEAYEKLNRIKDVVYDLLTFPAPVLALLNGQARGGGCELATACDFRYGLETASFGFVQGNLGLVPGFGGGELLYERVHPSMAAHWLMSARMYTAEEAFRIGWLQKIWTQEDIEAEVFSSFMNKTPRQMRILKGQYLKHMDAGNLLDRMEAEVLQCSRLWESAEHKRAVKKFLQTRKR
ncbi:enoyl-CoA hydratase/isomerase family protein [Halobacillus litoralis]|uniref:Enoyl-CoA hydratase/isomerase family protein n=1 Tax=Halobacillus litoralis TaxID=45668 RepID=A0A845DNK4_9BACI|nr:enoyl-CoA hydratase/isomerase family protein [Halobacillus litoralis]MYL19080.1 enoyl-CoA hydratase/isomerase family protein [Halobacillus litoralis]